eukprot:gene10312-21515_t
MATIVPESFKKKQSRNAELAAKAEVANTQAAAAHAQLMKEITDRAKSYEEEYESLALEAINNRRQAKANNQIFIAPEAKLVFVIRVRGIIGVSPKVKKILQLFRLRQLHNGVFIRVNAATTKMLRLVEPFVAYGYPNLKSIRELIYKRGHGKASGHRVPLTSNTIIQSVLTGTGVECVEDVIHEIFTVGDNFKVVSNFLWPFKLASPKGGFIGKKLNHFIEGGSCGFQGTNINALIKKMI